ncbi:MAG: 16S rRNA (cytidine(1402)-2'-O)-methyltransferase [Hyphomonadaceae bacterium]|nr:16S rRNA (cytidine(1402)-2'-O)-methyltransferase [Hyphomonadaceae bacterium]
MDRPLAHRSKDRDPTGGGGASPPLEAGLYVVATPIGNLRDITLRALDVLGGAQLVLAEDTRVTAKLLAAYGLSPRVQSYHEHNADAMRPQVLAALAAGQAVALVSDAGTPLVSDPGFKLVRDAVAAGHRVVPVPGASAALAGLVAAGLPTDRFLFAGFAPVKAGARAAFFAGVADVEATLVFYETGPRLKASLMAMAEAFGDRDAAIGRELTKMFEEVRRGRLSTLAAAIDAPPKGEIVVLVAPPVKDRTAPAASVIDAALRAHLGAHSVKEAAALVAEQLSIPRRDAYARALSLRDEKP